MIEKAFMPSEQEKKQLLRALGRNGKGFTEEDAIAVVEWATELRCAAALLSLALEGKIALSIVNDEVRFSKIHPQKDRHHALP